MGFPEWIVGLGTFLLMTFMTLLFVDSITVSPGMLEGHTSQILYAFFPLVLLTHYSFFLTMFSDAGALPANCAPRSANNPNPLVVETVERKKNGCRRYCRKCDRYKPDRAHHCSSCGRCSLKMDHHCVFVNNCVGYRNYKHFFLFLLYGAATCFFMTGVLLGSRGFTTRLRHVFDGPYRARLLLCLILSVTFALVLSVFAGFHFFLIVRGLTTLEYMEKVGTDTHGKVFKNQYDKGWKGNVLSVMGRNPLLWFWPTLPSDGGGGYKW